MATSNALRIEAELASAPIAFIDLAAQQARIRPQLDRAIASVLDEGNYIMGAQVEALEQTLAAFAGATHCISCANGTDAIQLVAMAEGIGRGDAVFVPSFTFMSTAEAIAIDGAIPVFVDVLPDTFNMDPASLQRGIDEAERLGLVPRMVIAVDLFGQPADYSAIREIAARERMILIADAAQSFGAKSGNARVGTLGDYTTTSFFPAKPLGCYGDGGAIFTEDAGKAAILRSLRAHGKGRDKYDHLRIGINSRLDTLQAAILIEKMSIFPLEVVTRDAIARLYSLKLAAHVDVPVVAEPNTSVWAQYTLRLPAGRSRAAFIEACKQDGVPTAIYYPTPLHRQTAYRGYPCDPAGCPVSEDLSARVVSLPMHPYIDEETLDRVVAAVIGALG